MQEKCSDVEMKNFTRDFRILPTPNDIRNLRTQEIEGGDYDDVLSSIQSKIIELAKKSDGYQDVWIGEVLKTELRDLPDGVPAYLTKQVGRWLRLSDYIMIGEMAAPVRRGFLGTVRTALHCFGVGASQDLPWATLPLVIFFVSIIVGPFIIGIITGGIK